MKKYGFDNEKYIALQREKILERISDSDNKLYLEFGGKLVDDYHATRVLPGFKSNSKIKILQSLKEHVEVVFCIGAPDIERNKIRADIGIPYDMDVLRLIDMLRDRGIHVGSIVITQFTGQAAADNYRKKLENRGEKVYIHTPTKGYPTDVETIVSDEGYGANPFIETTRPLVVVTAAGGGSGKLATCLSQLYHEYRHGNRASYAKFETFPVWNLPLKHPVNLAYEAATADLQDVNMIDSFHIEAYGEKAVNYNRDINVFPILRTILTKITGEDCKYKSPTDMGVNMAGFCITDDEIVKEAANQEIIRRYYKSQCDYKQGLSDIAVAQRVELLMNEAEIKKDDRPVVHYALEKAEKVGSPVVAIELMDGGIVTGKSGELMNASAAMFLNAIKAVAGINDKILLISPIVLEPMLKLKNETLQHHKSALNLEEVLIALSICAATNPMVDLAMSKIKSLNNCNAHSSSLVTSADEIIFKKLGIMLTCEPEYPTKDLYYV